MNVEQLPNPRRAAAGRLNGLLAKGRKTAEGRARSAQNAIKHNLSALHFEVLPTEDPAKYAQFASTFLESLAPQDPVEHTLVADIITARWKLNRIETMERTAFALEIERLLALPNHTPPLPSISDSDLLTWCALENFTHNPAFQLLARYRAQNERTLARALKMLKDYRATPKLNPIEPLPDPDTNPDTDPDTAQEQNPNFKETTNSETKVTNPTPDPYPLL